MSPIRPEEKARYPQDWAAISLAVKEEAGWRCECRGECGRHVKGGTLTELADDGRCNRSHGDLLLSGKPVVLTTAHLDHTPEHNSRENLRAYCQACHLAYDRDHHAEVRRARAEATE